MPKRNISRAKIQGGRNAGIAIQHERHEQETDSPLLPVEQLEKLQEFWPGAVDWVIAQTEAQFRRAETRRINLFAFITRLVGQIAVMAMAIAIVVFVWARFLR